MARKRLIDLIPEMEDRVDVPIEWTWLIGPFRRAFALPPEVAAHHAYVDTPARGWDLGYLARKIDPIVLSLGARSSDFRHNLQVLKGSRVPILLIGEPGVGKTTWLVHFFQNPLVRRQFYHYRLEGKAIVPAVVNKTSIEYVRDSLRLGILDVMRTVSQELSLDTPASVAYSGDADDMTIERAIRETADQLREAKRIGWVVLDNLDRRDRDLQRAAIEFGNNLASLGLRVLVALRPYSLSLDDAMFDFDCVTVPPPSLGALLKKRVGYALNSPLAQHLLAQMRAGTGATLSWTDGHVNDEHSLMRLWEKIADTLEHLPDLCTHLYNVHLGDMHEITKDLRELLGAGYFCCEMMRRLTSGEGRSQHEFITAYARGNYRHHRQTALSGSLVVNIYEAPGSDRKNRLLVIRFLQFLRKLNSAGTAVSFGELRRRLEDLGYDGDRICAVGTLLLKKRLALEVSRLADWHARDLTIEDEDELEISQSGTYYLDVLAASPRYILAMSEVSNLDDAVVKKMVLEAYSANDDFRNKFLFMQEVGQILEAENDRLASEGRLDVLFEATDIGEGFYWSGVTGCFDLARRLFARGKLSAHVLGLWQTLKDRADAIRERKTGALDARRSAGSDRV